MPNPLFKRVNRNAETLASFVAYCEANPSQRFWQALLNWSKMPYILISPHVCYRVNEAIKKADIGLEYCVDPYNFEGRTSNQIV